MTDVTNKTTHAEGTWHVAGRLLGRVARGEGWRMTVGVGLMLAGALVGLLQPWPMKIVLDNVLGDKAAPLGLDRLAAMLSAGQPKVALLVLVCVGLLGVQVLVSALSMVSTYALVAIGLRMVFKLRCALFQHIQRLSLRFHDATTVGDSLYRVAWDTYCAQALFNSGLVPALTSVITLIGIAAFMFSRDWLVTLVALGVGVPLLLVVRRMDKPMGEHSMKVHERESEMSARIQEALGGIRAVQAFGREGFETRRFAEKAELSLRASLRLTMVQMLSGSVVGLLLAAGTAAVVALTAWRVMQGRLTPGDVVLVVAYVGMIYSPLQTLAYTAATVQSAVARARRVLMVLDMQPDVGDAPDAAALPGRARGDIELRGVEFCYQPGRPVLRDVSLEIAGETTVALVGPSGAGKTTLVSLLMRFYDPSAGAILLDGIDLRKLTLASLRGNVALVLQEPVLFAASIAENIAYGRENAMMSQIEAAARSAGAHDFIGQLSQGYDTQIGERGVSLSGGQRQRLSIARAFLKDAPVLIMDEPTSALDAETEGQLLAALERLKRGRTTIIIAHRLSTIRNADRIVVMKEGRVVETGSHAELVERGGLYAHLYEVQFGGATQSAGSVP